MKYMIHWAMNEYHFGEYYTACSRWYKKPYTLLPSKVTCKSCIRMLKKRKLL